MTEKTAEERLREELEGKLSEAPQKDEAEVSEPVRKPVKPRVKRSRAASSKTGKPVNVEQRIDSFMEDFERRIAESLNAENVFSAVRSGDDNKPVERTSAAVVKSVRRRRKKPEPEPEAAPETSQPIPEPEPEPDAAPETSQPIPEPEPEPEAAPETSQPIPDTDTDIDIDSDSLDDDSANDIPVEIVDEPEQKVDDDFPDIPVIDAQEIAESSDNPEENTFPDIPVISPDPDALNDDFADITQLDDDIHESSEDSQEPSTAPENNSDFPPFADVVVNVDADLPQISSENQENSSEQYTPEDSDSESLSAPVTVTMPESTKTAEDKLLANIAEAMTGNPLTLDKPDPSEPYRLPENLLNPQNDPNFSPQSAEGKLIADISQAISESPIETAQNQANQNFEEDISPFDEMPLPEPIQTPDFDESYDPDDDASENASENEEEGDVFDEPFLPDFSAETEQLEQQPQENTLLDEDFADNLDSENIAEPFSVPDDEDSEDSQDTLEDTEDFSELPIAEDDTAVDEDVPDFSELPDLSLLDEPENDSEPINLEKTSEPESDTEPESEIETPPESEPDNQPITAEQRLAQELADFQNHDTSIDPEPEQSLLDEQDTPQNSDDESGDDFNFMSSWGDAASTMNYGDDEPDSQEQDTGFQDTFSQAEQPVTPTEPEARITRKPLNIHEQKTHQERFELPHPEVQNAALSPVWRILLQAVLGLLILAGLFSLFRLHQLTDRITSMMLYGNTPVNSSQSYDYAVDLIPDEEISSRMKLRGIEGWKIVGSRRTQDAATGRYGYEFIFMRPKPGNH